MRHVVRSQNSQRQSCTWMCVRRNAETRRGIWRIWLQPHLSHTHCGLIAVINRDVRNLIKGGGGRYVSRGEGKCTDNRRAYDRHVRLSFSLSHVQYAAVLGGAWLSRPLPGAAVPASYVYVTHATAGSAMVTAARTTGESATVTAL